MKSLMRFFRDEEGAVAIEYGLIAVGIAIAIIATVAAVGDQLIEVFETVVDELGG